MPPAVLLFFVVSTVGLELGALALWSKVDNHLHVLAALWRARGYCRIIDSLHSGCTFAAILCCYTVLLQAAVKPLLGHYRGYLWLLVE